MSYRIFETNDGKYAVQVLGRPTRVVNDFGTAESLGMMSSKLEAFLGTSISGADIGNELKRHAEERKEYQRDFAE